MFAGLKKKLQKRALDAVRAKTEAQRIRRFIPLQQVLSVIIMYKLEEPLIPKDLNAFIQHLERMNMRVDIVLVTRHKQTANQLALTNKYTIIGKDEVSWYGTPKNDKILQLMELNHDYFIDLTMTDHGLCSYLSAASMAKLKIGACSYDNAPYDLIIDIGDESSISYFEDQLFSYLQKIG
jgi:hypothetical protein